MKKRDVERRENKTSLFFILKRVDSKTYYTIFEKRVKFDTNDLYTGEN